MSWNRDANTNMNMQVKFRFGNTYKEIDPAYAKLSRDGLQKKVHDVTIFVDIIEGNHETIERVNFNLGENFVPRRFTHTTPIPITSTVTGEEIWRFATRQQVYGSFVAKINIIGVGGTVKTVTHNVSLNEDAEQNAYYNRRPLDFTEPKAPKPIKMLKIPDRANFGIELELTSPSQMDTHKIASNVNDIARRGSGPGFDVCDTWSAGRETSRNWKLVPDSSIVCSRSVPDCNKFELVSPILTGGQGLQGIDGILTNLKNSMPWNCKLKVNKSMGFHVHIDVSSFSDSQLIKICQQFIKYEEVFDTFMPPSRREGSEESNKYFQSNRKSIATSIAERVGSTTAAGTYTNRQCHDALGACQDIQSLVSLMNREGRYYKLNLQNISTGRQPTVEFRQHSSTVDYLKISAWVRFCISFCYNAAKLAEPTPFKMSKSVSDKFDALFQYVVKDRALRDYYRKRQRDVDSDENDETCACCTESASKNGGHCAMKRPSSTSSFKRPSSSFKKKQYNSQKRRKTSS